MIGKYIYQRLISLLRKAGIPAILAIVFTLSVYAQEPPPRPLEVNTTPQELCFGAFTLTGAGGSVIIYSNGFRGYSGNMILLSVSPAYSTTRLELIANPGTIVSLLGWPSSTLSNGTQTMSFTIDSTLPVLPYVINTDPPNATTLDLGASLNVGSLLSNPPGTYIGTFNITFVQE
ncbi:MAG: DUF4402 domain-containing protein [Bacteroidia bacterium]|nr:DUF4402 domain-containing protein [Bacteroidia bacterium]